MEKKEKDEKPFVEIFIESTNEKKLSSKEILKQIQNAYKVLYNQEIALIKEEKQYYLRIVYNSINDFKNIYEESYSMYVSIFENFLTNNPEFELLFEDDQVHSKMESNEDTNDFKENKNYLVLKYRTNYVHVMRRYFGFTNRVKKYFGIKIINEEIHNGYLRFIEKKKDFEELLAPMGNRKDWEKIFRLKKIELEHPLIIEFFEIFDEWKKNYSKK